VHGFATSAYTPVARHLAGTRTRFPVAAALRWFAVRLAGAALVVSVAVPTALAQGPTAASERSVKAAFIYKFLGYVDWPADAFAAPDAPLVIGVMGADDLAGDLGELVRGRDVNGHPLEVRPLRSGDALAGVNVLFVGAAERRRLSALTRAAATRGILTISEAREGLDDGSIINFMLIDGRVRFEVALDAAERAGIRLSSRLLAVAHYVRMGSR
jgi:hypothetical protein